MAGKEKKRTRFKSLRSGSFDGYGYTIKTPEGKEHYTDQVKFVDVDHEYGGISQQKAANILKDEFPGFKFKLMSVQGKEKNIYKFKKSYDPGF